MVVRIPGQFRSAAGGKAEVTLPPGTVTAVLESLCRRYPELRPKLFEDSGEKRKSLNLYLDKQDVRYLDGLNTQASDSSELIILPPASGG
jgi:molybdopterin synthase sulfur carrier subunit